MIHANGTKAKNNSLNIKTQRGLNTEESYAYTKVLIGLA